MFFKLFMTVVFFAVSYCLSEAPFKLRHWHESGGHSTDIKAGLDGKVIKVTTTKSSGAGSLKNALGQSGPRLIVFEVGGVISGVGGVSKGDVTIAGQTAPYPGITLIKSTFNIGADNVVISHIAVRTGSQGGADGINTSNQNIVLDHVASTWGWDETLTISGGGNITMFKCIIAEGLSHSKHGAGEHSKGTLIFKVCDNISIIGCLYAHNRLRNPRISDSRVILANSVVYAPAPGQDHDDGGHDYFVHIGDNNVNNVLPEVTFIGNVGLHGPETEDAQYLIRGHKNDKGKAFMRDNIIQDTAGNDLTVHNDQIIPLDTAPIWTPGMEEAIKPAHRSLYEVLRTVGPQPGQREDVTKRIVKSVADGTGGIINSQDDVGGYPKYEETRRPIVVPDGFEARRAWLDSLEDLIAVDTSMNLSRFHGRIGGDTSDVFKNWPEIATSVSPPKATGPSFDLNQQHTQGHTLYAAFTLHSAKTVSLKVYTLSGNAVAQRPEKYLKTGNHKFAVDVRHFKAGVYICRLKIGSKTLDRRIYIK